MDTIIAFCGEKRSGKDYFTKFLSDKYGIKRLSFSDQVREVCSLLYPWLPDDFSHDESLKDVPFPHRNNPHNYTPREIWIKVAGTLREITPDYFVDRFKNKLSFIENRQGLFGIITDLRTEEEFQFLQEFNIPVIKIIQPCRDGIVEDEFEDWVRNFNRQDFVFVNMMEGTEKFSFFFEEVLNQLRQNTVNDWK